MIESHVSSWSDICERLKEEFPPIGYSVTARDNLLKYRQTGGQSIWMFLARFEQLEGYLPRPLPFPEKMAAIQTNILSYYQVCLWDKEIVSPDELYRLCRRLDTTSFNIEYRDQHVVAQYSAKPALLLVHGTFSAHTASGLATKFAIAPLSGKYGVSNAEGQVTCVPTVATANSIGETDKEDNTMRSRVALRSKVDQNHLRLCTR
jgi:hypothetical protein